MGLNTKDQGLMTTENTNPPAPPAPAATPEPATFSREYVTELRQEAEGWRKKHKEASDLKAAAEAAATAAKTEAETAAKTANEAANQRVIRAELKAVAIKAGMVDLDGLKMLDLSGVKLDEKGEVVGAEEMIEAAKKAKPFLFGAAKSGSTEAPPKPGETTPKLAKNMTPEERKAALAAIKKR